MQTTSDAETLKATHSLPAIVHASAHALAPETPDSTCTELPRANESVCRPYVTSHTRLVFVSKVEYMSQYLEPIPFKSCVIVSYDLDNFVKRSTNREILLPLGSKTGRSDIGAGRKERHLLKYSVVEQQ